MAVLTVGLAQMDIVLGEPEQNTMALQALAADARGQQVDLLVLPELWSTGYMLERADSLACELGGGASAAMAEAARTYGLAIVGSVLARQARGVANTAVFYEPDGSLRCSYSKLHLFGLMQEDQFLVPGDAAPVLDTRWGKAGLAICYDLRFPELFRSYAVRGAGLVVMPSEWPYPRLGHWRTLVQARAIENQCFMVACNRVGHDRASHFCGHSMVVDPWGEVLVEAGDEPGLFVAQLDLDVVAAVRSRMSVLSDRRPDVYGAGG
ncbi:carbon-nitrogen family hydrolase [Chloroflexia bacterium SDU3-3]|nr:carbon-nitrogen family hydrolase [Chloroflexia bacterium SDU3-3]